MASSARSISARDLQEIEASLRGAPVVDPDLGDAPPPPPELEPALVHAVHASRSAVMVTDTDLDQGPTIRYVNPACERLTGFAAGDLVGSTPRLLQGPSTDRDVLDQIRLHLSSGLGYEGKIINYRKDGVPFVVSMRISPVRRDGRTVAFVAIQDDITREWLYDLQRAERLEALGDTLRPTPLPQPDDVELTCLSEPFDPSQLGGDWADAVEDRAGRLHLVMGDASGHGVVAGLYVGRYRWPLCALLRAGIEPAQALAEVGAMNADITALASIALVTISADRRHASIITAGHPDVIVIAPDGAAHRVRTHDALVGVSSSDDPPVPVVCDLAPGALVCLYSDGLVERRDQSLDVGIEALIVALTAGATADLDELAHRVVAEVADADGCRDDIAVMMARV